MAVRFKDHLSFLKRTLSRVFANSPFTIIVVFLAIFIGLHVALLYMVHTHSHRHINHEILSIKKRSHGRFSLTADLSSDANVMSRKGFKYDANQQKNLPRTGANKNGKDLDKAMKDYHDINRNLDIKDYIEENREIEDFYDIEETEDSDIDYNTETKEEITNWGTNDASTPRDEYNEEGELNVNRQAGTNNIRVEKATQLGKSKSGQDDVDVMEDLNKQYDNNDTSENYLEEDRVTGEKDGEAENVREDFTLETEGRTNHSNGIYDKTMEEETELVVKTLERLGEKLEGNLNYFISKYANDLNISNLRVSGEKIHRLGVTLKQYKSGLSTGNPLIDDYKKNNLEERGEMGKPVILSADENVQATKAILEFNVNTVASDVTPLNRLVPDSRINNCDKLHYDINKLPTASIIIPFYNEWPSLLLRTIYSVINRSPRHLVEEIILVDDASTLDQLQEPLEQYIQANFPQGLVRLVRQKERYGLIKARMRGCKEAKGDVLIYFDSHMEVNVDWLPPLLAEIARDNTVVAMATLDYVQADTLEYKFYSNFLIRYGWNWRLRFYELYFREDQIDKDPRKPRPGPTMVGAAFAMDKHFFLHLGGYDEMMTVWGGENLEMGWRVWLCGGQLLHVPCSRIGHVPRGQPYSFPGGREQVENFNYKRAISVWMGNYSRFVYNIFPDMKTLDIGDISERLELKSKRRCKDFSWYLKNIWPELTIYDENVLLWGQVKNNGSGLCLDNNNSYYQDAVPFHLMSCNDSLDYQAFALTEDGLLRSSVSCAVSHNATVNSKVKLEDCIIGSRDRWTYTADQQLVHKSSQLCLSSLLNQPILTKCILGSQTQMWTFHPYIL